MQKGHKGTTLTKADMEEKLRNRKYCHRIREIGEERDGKYTIKYVLDREVVPVITEAHIYADREGRTVIPEEYSERRDIWGADESAGGYTVRGRCDAHPADYVPAEWTWGAGI